MYTHLAGGRRYTKDADNKCKYYLSHTFCFNVYGNTDCAKDKHSDKKQIPAISRIYHNKVLTVLNFKQYLSAMGNIRLVIRYLQFLIRSKTKYDIHSPFIYQFITDILEDARHFYAFDEIEYAREILLHDESIIQVVDQGAGSRKLKSPGRKISDIATTSLTNKKFGELLFRLVNYYQLNQILELGTSLGISALYLAKANPQAKLTTIEGSPAIAEKAQQIFSSFEAENIRLINLEFSKALDMLDNSPSTFDLVYIDGNHQMQPTLDYFYRIKEKHASPSTIFIFDDIHWSSDMEAAWKTIQNDASVTATIDLFFKGLAFLNTGLHAKQHISYKY